MQPVLLSADGLIRIYSVPEAASYRTIFSGGTVGLCFHEAGFIQYLNNAAFPNQPSVILQEFEWADPILLSERFVPIPISFLNMHGSCPMRWEPLLCGKAHPSSPTQKSRPRKVCCQNLCKGALNTPSA